MSENDLKVELLDAYNKIPRVRAWRNNTGSIKKPGRFIEYGLRAKRGETGGADIILCVDGLMVADELKNKGEKPTPEQYAWGEALERAGGIWMWNDNFNTAISRVQTILRTGRAA